METSNAFNRIIDFQQVFFKNTLNLIKTFQNHGESFMNLSIGQTSWLPDHNKKMCSDWADTCQNSMTNYKGFMETSLTKASDMFASSVKPVNETSKKPLEKIINLITADRISPK